MILFPLDTLQLTQEKEQEDDIDKIDIRCNGSDLCMLFERQTKV